MREMSANRFEKYEITKQNYFEDEKNAFEKNALKNANAIKNNSRCENVIKFYQKRFRIL